MQAVRTCSSQHTSMAHIQLQTESDVQRRLTTLEEEVRSLKEENKTKSEEIQREQMNESRKKMLFHAVLSLNLDRMSEAIQHVISASKDYLTS